MVGLVSLQVYVLKRVLLNKKVLLGFIVFCDVGRSGCSGGDILVEEIQQDGVFVFWIFWVILREYNVYKVMGVVDKNY